MNNIIHVVILGTTFFVNSNLHGQSNQNCFLDDFELKIAEIPRSLTAEKPLEPASVIVAINDDTLGKISKYVFGNAIAAWAGAHSNSTNQDGQPRIISGELYGKHFKVFADSMKKAAGEIGAAIYIGGQILHFDGTTSWNFVDRTWNEGFFKEAGNSADFYVIYHYFSTSTNAKDILNSAATEPKRNMDFIRQDIINKNYSFISQLPESFSSIHAHRLSIDGKRFCDFEGIRCSRKTSQNTGRRTSEYRQSCRAIRCLESAERRVFL